MLVFFLTLAFVYGLSAVARQAAMFPSLNHRGMRPNGVPVMFAGACLILVSGLRSNIGDTYFYKLSFVQSDFTWDFVMSQKDIGFNLLQKALKSISSDPQILIFTVALLTNALIVYVLYKYSQAIEISLYVYIASGMYLVSMNGMRQYLAAAILFLATKYILDGNWKKYAVVVAVATLFHTTAMIMFPMYFIARKRAWSWTTIGLLSMTLFVVVGFKQFFILLFSVLENTQYGNYNDQANAGANVMRVAVQAVPLLLAFIGRKRLKEMVPYGDIIVNMSLLGLLFMLISTQNWIFARFSIYFGLYNLILIPWIIKLFVERQQKLIYFLILVFYGVYFFYEQVIALRIMYKSNFIMF